MTPRYAFELDGLREARIHVVPNTPHRLPGSLPHLPSLPVVGHRGGLVVVELSVYAGRARACSKPVDRIARLPVQCNFMVVMASSDGGT